MSSHRRNLFGLASEFGRICRCRREEAESSANPHVSTSSPRRLRMKKPLLLLTTVLAASLCVAQNWGGGRRGRGWGGGGWGGWENANGPIIETEGGVEVNEDTVRTARETATHSRGEDGSAYEIPNWTNAPGFEKDVFTFARIIYRFRGPSFLGW